MNKAEALAMNKLFLANITRWVEASKGKVDTVLRKVLFDLSYGVVLRTPVDTGRLRGNWQFGEASIPSGQLGDIDNPMPRIEAAISQVKAGTIHYVVNNLPYAPVIEYGMYPSPPKGGAGKTAGGYSLQAPAGMVRVTILEYQQYLNAAVIAVKGA